MPIIIEQMVNSRYYRPLDNFNRGKKQEHADRLFFKVPDEVKE